jgi:hypothetical protein
MISEGYRLPFNEYPTPCFLKNNKSAYKHPGFVAEAIEELLCNNCRLLHSTFNFSTFRAINPCLFSPTIHCAFLKTVSYIFLVFSFYIDIDIELALGVCSFVVPPS